MGRGQLAFGPGGQRHIGQALRGRGPCSEEKRHRFTGERRPLHRRRAARAEQTLESGREPDRAAGQRAAAAPARGQRRVHPLQAQQPVLEVAGERLHRRAAGEGLGHGRAESEQAVVRIRLRRPLVDQLREVADMEERLGAAARQRRRERLDLAQANQLAPLVLEVGRAHAGERLQAPAETGARAACAPRDPAPLAPVGGQEHHDPVRLAQLVGAKHQRVRSVQRHPPSRAGLPATARAPILRPATGSE